MISPDSFPSDWIIKPLNEVAKFLDHLRRPIKSSDRTQGNYPYYGANGQQGTIDDYIFDEPLVLLAEDGGYFGDPYRPIAYKISGKTWVNNHAHVLRCNTDLITTSFLFRVLSYYDVRNFISGTTRAKLTKSDASRIMIPIPPLSEQRRIVEILDQADTLRKMRAEADAKSDRILPALFIKMFGDPATNPMGWDIVSVEKLFSKERSGTKCGPFGSALKKHEYVDNGVPVWGIDNIKPNQFLESDSLFITPTKYEELKSYTVEPGDIIISRAGTVGRMCVARPQQSPSIISTNLIRLTLDKKHISPEYFTSLLSYFPASVNQLRASGDDGAYSFMNTTILKSLKIPLPPFELQNEYTLRMAEIRRLNAKQIESQATLNHLFQSLLYQAFSGELTAKWREANMKELLLEMEEQAKALKLNKVEANYKQLTL